MLRDAAEMGETKNSTQKKKKEKVTREHGRESCLCQITKGRQPLKGSKKRRQWKIRDKITSEKKENTPKTFISKH